MLGENREGGGMRVEKGGQQKKRMSLSFLLDVSFHSLLFPDFHEDDDERRG